MKFLITGQNGFIGSHLVEACKSRNYDVIEPKKRLDIVKNKKELIILGKIADVIIHCAAVIKGSQQDMYKVNVESTLTIAEAAENKILINMGTQQTTGFYGITKWTGHNILASAKEEFKYIYLPIFAPGIYGPNQRANYNCVVPTFAKAIAEGKECPVNDGGSQEFTLVHINSLIIKLFDIIFNIQNGDTIESYSCEDISETWTPNDLAHVMKYELEEYPRLHEIVQEYR